MDTFPSPSDLDATSIPHPYFEQMTRQLRAHAAAGTGPPNLFEDMQLLRQARAARTALFDATYHLAARPECVTETVRAVQMRDGYQSETRVFQPAAAARQGGEGGSPLVMLVYGGGFVAGENRALAHYARALVRLYSAVVVAISYRLAPEHPFPVPVNDAWDAFLWARDNAAPLGADLRAGFVIGGVSAGANIAAVVARRSLSLPSRGEGEAGGVTGVWLCEPVLLHDEAHVPEKYRPWFKAREQNAVTPVFDLRSVKGMQKLYSPDRDSEWYSPFNKPSLLEEERGEQLDGYPEGKHPRTYVQVAGCDPLRDDGVIYEKLLREKGTETKLTVWSGMPHAHFAFFPDEEFSRAAVRDTIRGFAWLLGKEVPEDGDIDDAVAVTQAPN